MGLHPNALRALAPRGPTCTALQLIAYMYIATASGFTH